ncbi:MAG: P-loop NTPase fold protein [Planctomycetota bacterium]|jgi:hypothetical protein|nr:P-loop NTPase fold protein [Planctomycetota bacterium]
MARAKKSAKGKSDFETFVKRPAELTVLTDHPMPADEAKAGFERDPFNLRYKLGPVYDIVRYKTPDGEKNRDRDTPLAILVSGGWGTGKTSAMRWLEGLLNGWNKVAGTDDVKVHPVWFYPWKYDSKEDVWRGLIAEVIIESIKVENVTWQRAKNAAKQFGLFLGKSFLHALASVKFRGKVSAGVAEAEAEADLTCLKDILGEYQEAAHPEKAYLNEFEGALKDWVTETLGANERIIVFIDDLDRCMPDIALQVLEALKLYLNIPKLIFVVGVDRTVIEKLVVEHYTKLGLVRRRTEKDTDSDHKQRRDDEAKARQYLAKMFQVEVELAPSQQQVEAFFADQLAGIPYWKNNLKEEAHRDLFRDVVLELAHRNPREVKRLLNSALMAGAGTEMMLAQDDAAPPTFAQGLQDYFVRAILQKYYPSLADMTATDVGRQFFVDWSSLVAERQKEGKDTADDGISRHKLWRTTLTHTLGSSEAEERVFTPEEEPQRKDRIVEQLRHKPQYADYLRLTSDQLLAALMQIPFSAELAQRTRKLTATAVETVLPVGQVRASGTGRFIPMPIVPAPAALKDRTIIREAMARSLGKSPSDLTDDDDQEVTDLYLSSSQVSDVTLLAALTNLQRLDLDGTQISGVTPLAALTNLQLLDLDGTRVSDVTPLAALTNLQWLDLRDTQVRDVTPLAALTNLQWLCLQRTQVSDVTPLMGLTSLQRLELRGTQVSEEQVKRLQEALPKLEITR